MNGRSCAGFVAVYNGHPSGTRNTIEYAKKKEFLLFCATETLFLPIWVNIFCFRRLLSVLF